MSDRDGDALERAREVDYQRYKRSHPDSTEPGPGAKLALANLMEEFHAAQTTARNEGREEGLVQGFADCGALVVAMLENFATKETTSASAAPGGSQETWHRARAGVLCEAALAVSLCQHRTDAYDPDEILAAHRAVVNRSQAKAAGRAGGLAAAAAMSKKAKTARARHAAKARHGRAKGERA